MEVKELYKIYRRHPRVVIDSRKVTPGSIFFALRGDRFDGNRFAVPAIEAGAAYAVVDDPALSGKASCLFVEDSLEALQKLARHHRRQFHIPILAITGSNGKTTTKELVAAVLGSRYRLHFTQGNLNNHIGVPLTLLGMSAGLEIAVIEMGANHQGEIDSLCRIAEPSHGLITNIGKAHLEGFGGIEGVKKGKSELYRFLAETDGMAFVNRDEPFLEELAAPVEKKVFYRQSEKPTISQPDIEVQLLSTEPFVCVSFIDREGRSYELRSHLIGGYNFGNIATAVALGKYFKVPCAKIVRAIEGYIPSNNRSQILEWNGNTVILDAYNANPNSMEAAIRNFSGMKAARKIAVLGDMLELGTDSPAEHEAMVRLVLECNFDGTAFVGNEFESAAKAAGLPHFPDVKAARAWLDAQAFRGCHILLKGSRGIGLERLLER